MAAERRRADRFAAAADGTSHIRDAETQQFLAIVEQLRGMDAPSPDPRFVGDLRSRLVAAASGELVAIPVERRPIPSRALQAGTRRRRLISAAAVACIVAGSGVGVAAASESALPGDVLYPVKRGLESVELSLAASPADRGQRYVDSASTRLSEAQALVSSQGNDPAMSALVVSTLTDFTAEANSAAEELITAYRRDASTASIADLRAFADSSAQRLQALDKIAPTDVQGYLLLAARTVTTIDGAARSTCATCSSLPPITLGDEFATLQQQLQHRHDQLQLTPTTPPGSKKRPHRHNGPGGHHGRHITPTQLPGVSPTPKSTLAPSPTITPPTVGSSVTSSLSVPPATSPISPSADPTVSSVSPPSPSVSLPSPSVSLPSPSVSLPSPSVSLPSPSVSLPSPSVSLPTPKVSPPTTTVSLPDPSVSLPTTELPNAHQRLP